MKKHIAIVLITIAISVQSTLSQTLVENNVMELNLSTDGQHLWQYKIKQSGFVLQLHPPVFEIDGKQVECTVDGFSNVSPLVQLKNGVYEKVFQGTVKSIPALKLKIVFRTSQKSAVVRFKYILNGPEGSRLTKLSGKDNLTYLSTSFAPFKHVKEVQFSNYDLKFHSYILKEQVVEDRFFENNYTAMGPMVVAGNTENTVLLAYEHGSQYGNEFLRFNFLPDHTVMLSAVKGNYLSNQPISKGNEFESVWFEIAGVNGDEEALATQYRNFMLKDISQNTQSREPYIYYNTWGRQERMKAAGNTYLSSMNLKQTLDEIEQAHKMGIDVFVIDAGWFLKTGDWTVNTTEKFFPDTLKQVVSLLKQYEMKLGLWFNPTVAAITSNMLEKNRINRTSMNGKVTEPYPIWETEKSVPLCLSSTYWEDFSDELIRLVKELGVTYFKWDAIGQGNCDLPGHFHGTAENTPQERIEYDAFLQPVFMSKIVDKLCQACPEAIVDFDVTEDGKSFGLAFLSSGKYFIMNNGPYFQSFDIPRGVKLPNVSSNIFVYPGPARGWFTRQVLSYDKWIPSILFLTHYQPDEPASSQTLNVASLILGQNGIWGEILKTSPEGTKLIGNILSKYKQVKYDITLASPVCYGSPGELIEIHEKVNPENGKGAVVIFGAGKRDVTYITKSKVNAKIWKNDGVTVSYDKQGRAIIKASFTETNAKIIFFGVN